MGKKIFGSSPALPMRGYFDKLSTSFGFWIGYCRILKPDSRVPIW
ncbi:hypothetical protein QUB80_18405 [Chlorogloeopsis sp. ULAP01]|nr:hypothetical protein [Chlorogloeopsis sp. ULAP01]